jgi:hypothetical protein
MIARQLNLQLPVQSVPITAKVVSSNPAHRELYSIEHYVIKFVSDMGQVGWFPPCTLATSTSNAEFHDIAEILLGISI